ncbi:MAG: 16S rRNA (guanine(527)-N(7))-methyltransferase RsmG [Clostridia bacterium]|nr:16S rRNA (guanine(527)-N(7))-methyltransferase RsmG [Clostridia bacterium]MBR2159948.1 16S rRNA (guanine(527)-N(7))-methyltransferase RsmG [Clostridia bacterium]
MQDVQEYEKIVLEDKRETFEEFRKILLEYNEKYNLTTIIQEQDVYYKHFLDSVVGESFFTCNARVAEIGSGAGFPSIPLKIIRPDLQLDLFESVGKKCEFLRVVVDKLQLSNVHIYNARAEDCAKDVKFREKYDCVTARAVARMNTLCEYCLPFVKVGGKFIAYKSGDTAEAYEAENAYKILGGKLQEIQQYDLPKEYGARTLIVVNKVKNTPPKYPRGQGKERKNPL